MPWKVATLVSLRFDMIRMILEEGASVSEASRQFGVSRKTAYKWLKRFKEGGTDALVDRSRRPLHSPRRKVPLVEEGVPPAHDGCTMAGGEGDQPTAAH